MWKCIEFSHCLHVHTHLKIFFSVRFLSGFRTAWREKWATKKNVNIIGSNQCSHVEIYLLLNSVRLFFRTTQLWYIYRHTFFLPSLLLLLLFLRWKERKRIEKEIHIKALVVIEVICTFAVHATRKRYSYHHNNL